MPTFADDHAEITNLLARYCILLDLDDVEGWVGLFTSDGKYEVYGRTFVGHDGLRRMLSGAPGGLHLGGPAMVDVIDGDRATTWQNLLFIERATGVMRRSLYDDELIRTPDGWRIARRRCRFITTDGLADRPED